MSSETARGESRRARAVLATVIVLVLSLIGAMPTVAAAAPAPPIGDIGSAATAITASASKVSIFNSQAVRLQFDLASGDEPIAGATTEIRYAGRSRVVTLDASGRGSVSISDLPVGAAAVVIRFAGDADHAASSTVLKFSVAPRPTKIVGLSATSTDGADILVRYVVTSNGKLLPGAKTAITYDGATVWATTGSDGRVAVTLNNVTLPNVTLTNAILTNTTLKSATPKGRPAAPPTVRVRYFGDAVNGRASATTAVKIPNPCPAAAKACIDLTSNTTWLQSGGSITYGPVPMTSGRPGYRTRPGMFTVFWKHKNHVSSIYGAPMPNSIFFDGGIAFHTGSLTVPSHGCIHLSRAASDMFWSTLRNGDKVYVWGTAPY